VISFLDWLHHVSGLSTEDLWLDALSAAEPGVRSDEGRDWKADLWQEGLVLLSHELKQIVNLLQQLILCGTTCRSCCCWM
jgi:hypothetical protein